MFKEVHVMQQDAKRRYGGELTLHSRSLGEQLDKLERKAYGIDVQLGQASLHAKRMKAQQKFGSRWLIRLYLIAILAGCCSALIVMIILRWMQVLPMLSI